MPLNDHVQLVRDQLEAAGAALGGPVEEAAARLNVLLEPAVRLALQNALAEAASDLDTQLDGVAHVELRLLGGEPVLSATVEEAPSAPTLDATTVLPVLDAVDAAPGASETAPMADGAAEPGETGTVTRFTLRVPEALKERVDQAAAAQGVSVNAWFVRAAERSLALAGAGYGRVLAEEIGAAITGSLGIDTPSTGGRRTGSARRMSGWQG